MIRAGQAREIAEAAEIKREHPERENLAREGLGARHADLGAGMQVNSTVRLASDRGTDHVANGKRKVPLALALAEGRQCIRGFAGLADGDDDRVVVDRRIAVAELAGVLDLDGNLGELLDEVFAHLGGMVTGAAGGQNDAPGLASCRTSTLRPPK